MKSAIRILICDDSKDFSLWFYKKIEKIFCKEDLVCTFDIITNPKDVFNDQVYDLAFLDIDMPEISGFQLCQYLYTINRKINIIFVTGKDSLVYKAIEYQPFDFIRKRYIEEELESKANRWMSKIKPNTYCYVIKGQKILIDVSDILIVQKFRNYLTIYTANNEWKERKKITVCLEDLNKLEHSFVMVHRSILVNMANVVDLRDKKFILVNGQEITIAKQRLSQVILQYNLFKMERRHI
ncbi:LytR/AlgR family response regulator transcription factor [Holdemania massiliensis]|uniref:LytR/AlgR family response regulator transcription factor n=1 Tax=Holdemania massiliensis TaxID=1468449 RepID=UPI0035225ADC